MEREPDSLVDQYLDALYDKAKKEDAIPWNDTPCLTEEIEETFPGEP